MEVVKYPRSLPEPSRQIALPRLGLRAVSMLGFLAAHTWLFGIVWPTVLHFDVPGYAVGLALYGSIDALYIAFWVGLAWRSQSRYPIQTVTVLLVLLLVWIGLGLLLPDIESERQRAVVNAGTLWFWSMVVGLIAGLTPKWREETVGPATHWIVEDED